MWRIDVERERGAVAVLVAILMTALIGFAALGVDVANMASDKQQLQNGADAGAFAIAQACASGDCGDYNDVARTLAESNKNDSEVVEVSVAFDTEGPNTVTVTAGDDTEHWFAGIFGPDSSDSRIRSHATARWGTPLGGISDLPLAISSGLIECLANVPDSLGSGSVFQEVTPGVYEIIEDPDTTPIAIYLPNFDDKNQTDGVGGCFIDSHWTPGGLGWLATTSSSTCEAETAVGEWAPGSTGVSPPQPACKETILQDLINQTVLIPFFENPPEEPGANAEYLIKGYVAFHVTGFRWPGAKSTPEPISGCNKCIEGYFTKAPADTGAGNDDITDTGVVVIELIH